MPTLIPVIHTVDFEQVIYNAKVCADNGLENLMLIDHRVDDDSIKKMEEYINYIKTMIFPFSIGVNFLQLDTKDAIITAEDMKLEYLWADKSYIDPKTLDKAQDILNYKKKTLYFGCVAFKYQKQPTDLEWACKQACDLMDVIVTSGFGTGKPPTVEKIKSMRSYIGNKLFAIASGVSSDNKKLFDDYVDYYMVASSIIDKNERIIESELKKFCK